MLANFIQANRDAIVARTHARASLRSFRASDVRLADGVPVFLTQLCEVLVVAESSDVVDHAQIRASAGRHGHDLLRMGLTIGQVVQCYGDVCQVVTDLAVEQGLSISAAEFHTLNLCLDDATAQAVTQYSSQRDAAIASQKTESIGILAHELRNLLNTALLSFELIKAGQVGLTGSTGLVLGRSLIGLRNLIDRSLAEVRLDAGIDHFETISVADLLSEIEIGAALQAGSRSVRLRVTPVERSVYVEGDRQILAAAIANLLQNAFKFTRASTEVALTTKISGDRVLFQVEDECGGLPPGKAEELFRPFSQQSSDRSGIGLGLTICRRAAEANAGELRVLDVPGRGCVFTLDLPRKLAPPLAVVEGGRGSSEPDLQRGAGVSGK